MDYWQSYKSIVLLIPRIINVEEKRDLRNTDFVKDTLSTRRGRKKGAIHETTKYNGNKISKNSRNIKRKTTRNIYVNISLSK